MGKKANPARTADNSHVVHHHHKKTSKDFKHRRGGDLKRKNNNNNDSAIKVLRPKVYITDNSSFKSLVQQLTGRTTTVPSPPPEMMPEKAPPYFHQFCGVDEETSSYSYSYMDDLGYSLSNNSHTTASPESLSSSDYMLRVDHDVYNNSGNSLFSYEDLESWILDLVAEPEVSIYDYELSGIL